MKDLESAKLKKVKISDLKFTNENNGRQSNIFSNYVKPILMA